MMCTVCGCGEGETRLEGEADAHAHEPPHAHAHSHGHGHDHTHAHAHDHGHAHTHDGHTHDYGAGPARAHAPGLSQARMVRIEADILGKNNEYAAANRRWFAAHAILALNLVSSPGSGKTALLTRTLEALRGELPAAVIEGDQQTAHDAERIRATGVKALQINTGKGCHLDAHMVGHALEALQPAEGSLLFIENVGNLVCPAAFDLGEAHKVVILSVTEGEDKPLKYPDMFHAADLMLLNKTDLLPYLDFDVERCLEYARRVNPRIRVLQVSARSGAGMEDWYRWLRASRALALIGHPGAAEPGEPTYVSGAAG
jgi:hydrogenase nickel incorporation protein HypB